jgi:hypothetical protein
MARMSDGRTRNPRVDMHNEYAVVVTDTGSPRQLLRCLREVASTVPPEVEIIAVSRQLPSLGRLVRRVRRVQVRAGEALHDTARGAASTYRFSVIAPSQCRWTDGWLDNVVQRIEQAGGTFGVLGDPGRCVEVNVGAGVVDGPPIDLNGVAGIEVPTRSASGSRRDVTISASLIVKDEEENIGRCIAAVSPMVDEVVVYDTGSTDNTIQIAESAGALVIRGYWDDNFGAARNRSLAHCASDWILVIDADEVATGDPIALRQHLSRSKGELVRAKVVNASWTGAGAGVEMVSERLFRRTAGTWKGALHERIISHRTGGSLVAEPVPAPLRLMHFGYTTERLQAKDKAARNLAIARAQIESGDESGSAWCNYGRSLAMADRMAEALDALTRVLSVPALDSTVVLAGRTALECLRECGFGESDADMWLTALAERREAPGRIDMERAWFALRAGDVERAAGLLAGLTAEPDCWGTAFDLDEAAGLRADVLYEQGRALESFELLLDTLSRRVEDIALASMVLAAQRAEVPLVDVARRVPEQFLMRSLREVLRLGAAHADEWLDAVWTVSQDQQVLVAAALVCRGLGIDRVLVWEMRCMELGAPVSPLRSIAEDSAAPTSSRCLARAVLGDVLGDQMSCREAVRLVDTVPADERDALYASLHEFAPSVLAELQRAAGLSATTTA